MSAPQSLLPFRSFPDITVGMDTPKRTVVSLLDAAHEPDPTYSTVLFRVKVADGSWLNIDLGAADAQRLGSKLNQAGGGVLSEAEELRKALRIAVEGMEKVPFGDTVDGAWGEFFTQALMKAREVLNRG